MPSNIYDHLNLSPPKNEPASPGSSIFDIPTQANVKSPPEKTPILIPSQIIQPTNQHLDTHQASGQEQGSPNSPSFLVISGGTGGNAICAAFGATCCHALPVSDDGGSSSEIIRVLGGPSIGDIRSRLIRLIPPAAPGSPLDAIRTLLSYRLPSHCSEREARDLWRDIVEGRSLLWTGVPNDRKETVRGFLVYFESELLKRAHKNFSFLNGSIGNYFLAAAQGFFRSLSSAIFLFSSITNSQANILPVIATNHTVTIAAELENGERIVGQCEISHPVQAPVVVDLDDNSKDPCSPVDGMGGVIAPRQNVLFEPQAKSESSALTARILRLYYINAYGQEIHPTPNPDYVSRFACNDVLVYSCGSLWTSIVPCLALRGVATAIARSRSLRAKVLLLNSRNDRETDGYTAADYIKVISRTLNARYHHEPYGLGNASTTYPISAFVTHLVYLRGSSVRVNIKEITSLGVRCLEAIGKDTDGDAVPLFDAGCVRRAIAEILSGEE